MKKALSLILALAMVMSLAITAFAAETIAPSGNNGSMDVGADYVAGSNVNAGEITAVTLTWTAVNPKFTDGNTTYTWDAQNHKYVANKANGSWANGSFTVTVTNHSNVAITATAAYSDAEGGPETSVTWTEQSVTCESAAKGIDFTNTTTQGAATTGEIEGTVKVDSGTITENTAKVGTITITISKS